MSIVKNLKSISNYFIDQKGGVRTSYAEIERKLSDGRYVIKIGDALAEAVNTGTENYEMGDSVLVQMEKETNLSIVKKIQPEIKSTVLLANEQVDYLSENLLVGKEDGSIAINSERIREIYGYLIAPGARTQIELKFNSYKLFSIGTFEILNLGALGQFTLNDLNGIVAASEELVEVEQRKVFSLAPAEVLALPDEISLNIAPDAGIFDASLLFCQIVETSDIVATIAPENSFIVERGDNSPKVCTARLRGNTQYIPDSEITSWTWQKQDSFSANGWTTFATGAIVEIDQSNLLNRSNKIKVIIEYNDKKYEKEENIINKNQSDYSITLNYDEDTKILTAVSELPANGAYCWYEKSDTGQLISLANSSVMQAMPSQNQVQLVGDRYIYYKIVCQLVDEYENEVAYADYINIPKEKYELDTDILSSIVENNSNQGEVEATQNYVTFSPTEQTFQIFTKDKAGVENVNLIYNDSLGQIEINQDDRVMNGTGGNLNEIIKRVFSYIKQRPIGGYLTTDEDKNILITLIAKDIDLDSEAQGENKKFVSLGQIVDGDPKNLKPFTIGEIRIKNGQVSVFTETSSLGNSNVYLVGNWLPNGLAQVRVRPSDLINLAQIFHFASTSSPKITNNENQIRFSSPIAHNLMLREQSVDIKVNTNKLNDKNNSILYSADGDGDNIVGYQVLTPFVKSENGIRVDGLTEDSSIFFSPHVSIGWGNKTILRPNLGQTVSSFRLTVNKDAEEIQISEVRDVWLNDIESLEGFCLYYDNTALEITSNRASGRCSLPSDFSPDKVQGLSLPTEVNADLTVLDVDTINAASETITNSARIIKDNIQELDERHDVLFDGLQPRSFVYKNGKNDRTHYGLIVDEFAEALEGAGLTPMDCAAYCLVDPAEPGGMGGIRYGELVPLLIRQVQQLKETVSRQQQQINSLVSLLETAYLDGSTEDKTV